MSAISQTIGNVLGGISAQPDSVKIPGQVRLATNVYLDPTFGCTKRPGTEFIENLGSDIPVDAKWFPVFRDNQDRYVVCVYRSGSTQVVRVFTADTGEERTVQMEGEASAYIAVNDVSNLNPLTINDYTFLVNSEKVVSMSSVTQAAGLKQALVVINQVSYNTTYAVDFLRDGDAVNQVKVRRASRLSVSPASFEEEDTGVCSDVGIQNFTENGSGNKAGLGFRLDTTCTPTLVTTEIEGDFYPTRINVDGGAQFGHSDYGRNIWATIEHGDASNYAEGSYLYSDHVIQTPAGELGFRVEVRVEVRNISHEYIITDAFINSYTISNSDDIWTQGMEEIILDTTTQQITVLQDDPEPRVIPVGSTYSLLLTVTGVQQGDKSFQYDYKSVYKTTVSLNNGGLNWEIGDTVDVTLSGRNYTVKVEETTFSYSYEAEASATFTTPSDTSSGVLTSSSVVSSLVNSIVGLSGYTARPVGNVIIIDRTDGRDFNLQTRGGVANNALYGIKDTVNDVSLLPPQCEDGIVLKIANTEASDADDYYVKFKTEGSIPGQGAWEETIKPGIPLSLNPNTMPHALIRESDGTFTLRPLTKEFDENNFWQDRKVGDEVTSPAPTFVGKTIREAFFYQNRLGFLSDDTVVLSQAGDYFNFFQGSAIAISDADPIDMSTSTTRPAILKHAIGTPKGLLLFAENSQFLMSTEDVAFGPSTVKLDEVSNFAYKSSIKPVETGVSILFTTESNTATKVFELATDSLSSRPEITDNTRIVPELVPPGLSHIVSVPNQSLIIMGDGTENLYVFKFFNTGNQRQLAGWTTWKMPTDIKLASFDHDTGYFIGRNGSNTILSKLELVDDPDTAPIAALGSRFQPRLDHWVDETRVTFQLLSNGDTKVSVPSGLAKGNGVLFLAATYGGSETFYVSGNAQTDSTGDYFVVSNRLAEYDIIVGVGYDMVVELPSFFVKEENKADRRNPPMIENVYINVFMSGRYECSVDQKGYATRTIPLEVVQADIYEADTASIQEDGVRAIGVYGRGDLTRLTIKADGPLPAALTSYSWEGHYSTRGIARR
jgi:hypothetical protein